MSYSGEFNKSTAEEELEHVVPPTINNLLKKLICHP